MRKVTVNVKVQIDMEVEEGIAVDNIIDDLDYRFDFDGEEANILNTELYDYNIVSDASNSKLLWKK